MYKLTLALALLPAAFGANADYTVDLLLLGFGTQGIVGSVIATDATATTYALTCADVDSPTCGIPPDFTFTQGPATMHYTIPYVGDEENTGYLDAGCMITSDHGQCSGSVVETGRTTLQHSEDGPITDSFSNSGKGFGAQPVTITPGATTGVAATTTGDAAEKTGTSSVSTGGVPMITGKAQWVFGGAAAVAAFAAM